MNMVVFQKMEKNIESERIEKIDYQRYGVILWQMKNLERLQQKIWEDIVGIKIVD